MVEGRSKQVFKQWLAARPKEWSKQIEVVAMDGFSGFKTAASEELPDAVPVMDPFHVVRLAGDALDLYRRPARHPRAPRSRRRPALRRPPHPPHRRELRHREADRTALDAVFAAEEHCRSKRPGASTSASSPPTANPTRTRRRR
ncbi:transposase [Microbacterium aurum]